MEIERATPDMFEGIFEVLREFGGRLRKNDWRHLLDYRFGHQDYRGWVSREGDEITGYLGAIFSERQGARFCALTSWIVKQRYRRASLHLLGPMLELEDHNLLNLSPSVFTLLLFRKLGFVPLEERVWLIPLLAPRLSPRGAEVVSEPAELAAALPAAARRLYADHQPYAVHHFAVVAPEGVCYVVASRTRFRRWPVSFLHHVSDPALLRRSINLVQRHLFGVHRTLLTVVDARLLGAKRLPGAVSYALRQPRLYRPATPPTAPPAAIDSLYTEFVVLNPRRWTFNY